MNILIADDHAIVRKGLAQILLESDLIARIAEAGSGQEVLDALARDRFDVVVLDLNMPEMSGFQVLEHIISAYPDTPVLVLSMHDEEQYGVRVLRAGAAGYVAKGTAPDTLLDAVARVADGRRYISPTLAEKLLDVLDDPNDTPLHASLSDREFDVLHGIVNGHSLTRIGEQLNVSVKTVSTYRSRILEKLHLDSNAELVKYAMQHDLFGPV
ncbi:MAG: response regulator transcription factor [Rhodothermales bacterium]